MTVSLSPETEELLSAQAWEKETSEDELAVSIQFDVLTEEVTGDLSDVEAIREAIERETQGRFRPFAEYVAEHKARYPRTPR